MTERRECTDLVRVQRAAQYGTLHAVFMGLAREVSDVKAFVTGV